MSTQIQQASILSGRQLVLAVTVALHVAAISALMAWQIAEVMTRTPDDPIKIVDVKPDPVRNPLPAKSDPKITRAIPVPWLPDPVIPPIAEGTDETRIFIPTDESIGGGSGAVPEQHSVPPDTPLQYRATRSSDDYYPPQAIRMEQEGVTIVRTCVAATGALSATPLVVKSSHSRLLDAAAITWAREALQFTPATSAGAAVATCKEFRVNFTLH